MVMAHERDYFVAIAALVSAIYSAEGIQAPEAALARARVARRLAEWNARDGEWRRAWRVARLGRAILLAYAPDILSDWRRI